MKATAATRTSTVPNLDRLAIWLSGLCAVHCLTTAIAIGVLSSFASVLHAPIIHEVGLGIAMVLAVLALGYGVRKHGKLLPIMVGGLGLCIMALAVSLPHGWSGEIICTLAGVALLAVGHMLNRRALR